MQPDYPFNPFELIAQGLLQAFDLMLVVFWSLPFWAKVGLFVLLAVRFRWPWLVAERTVVPRRRRRRREWRELDWY